MQRLATAGPAAVLYLTAAATLNTSTTVLSIVIARSSNTTSCRHLTALGMRSTTAPSPPQPQATECGLTTVPGTAQQQSASRGRRLSNFKNLIEHFNWRLTRSTNFKLKIPRSAGCCRPCVGLFCCQRRRRRHRCKFLFAAPAGAGAAAAASAARTSRAVRRHLELLIYCKVCMCTLLWTIGFLSSPHTGVQQQLFK
eukprot:TRINITY_DN3095_c0_g1_i3.p1 TRINITY_DN3095_c0_g1~~TRINITY_DN3095_c0_g1_i3.p1  ORF type:complete len:197 (+),score=36.48 TRINITY_DN3095_c0_g1_i3:1146-1736(+)